MIVALGKRLTLVRSSNAVLVELTLTPHREERSGVAMRFWPVQGAAYLDLERFHAAYGQVVLPFLTGYLQQQR